MIPWHGCDNRSCEEAQMPRLLGVDIPNNRPTVIALTYLYGVGPKTSRDLCHKAGVNPETRARDLQDLATPETG